MVAKHVTIVASSDKAYVTTTQCVMTHINY